MPCLCVIWDRNLDLSRIIHDIETEEGMLAHCYRLYVYPRVLRGILVILSIGERRSQSFNAEEKKERKK